MNQQEIPKSYDPKTTEQKIYDLWLESGFFNPDKLPKRHKKPFCITIPPPNVTGELHMGHTLQHIIHDIIIRKKRMEGYRTLWLPGTDHAGIATQNKVEQKLKKEGKTRFDLGREKFIEEVWKWKEQYGNIIFDQMKKLGDSCDWSRARFTMDEKYANAVNEVFMHYYNKGWIYRGLRVVNWCIRCGTSLSDLELEHKEEKGKLWHIRYPLKNTDDAKQKSPPLTKGGVAGGSDAFITVATTRPETMLGDAAVAVNPKDAKYKNLIGKTVILPIQNREIPIIADEAVDSKFGTGAVKVTPLHDFNDWEISQRHSLKQYKVIDERGRMAKDAGPLYHGLKINECREKIIAELQKQGLLEKEEDFTHQVPRCYRCNAVIEPLASLQWFLKMSDLAKLAIKAVKSGEIELIPKHWESVYFDWLKNIKDWCISRQLWWGHRLPVFSCRKKQGEFLISNSQFLNCPLCKNCKPQQNEDVLDTWFSSALWPFATLGFPQKTEDLKTFFPTDILITDRGIINLWVTRMIFSSYEFLGKKPFSKVIIHATVLAKDGQRMSKSLGTGVDPIRLIDTYGADATRFGMIYQAMGGQDIKFAEEHIVAGKKFCNKLWNISRFAIMQMTNDQTNQIPRFARSGEARQIPSLREVSRSETMTNAQTTSDKKILARLKKTTGIVTKYIEQYEFGQAAHTLYNFVWHDFADVYIEETKDRKSNIKNQRVLLYVLIETLKLLHPFIPFITEQIYQTLPIKNRKLLLIENWPK